MNTFNLKVAAIAIGIAFSAGAMAQTLSKADYTSAKSGISAEFKFAKAACGAQSGNARDICKAEAGGKEKIARAELEEKYKPGAGTHYKVRIARAEADYALAKEKCDDAAGNVKDVCVKEAKAAAVSAKADAKVQLKTTGANAEAAATTDKAIDKASGKRMDARNDAAAVKSDADYAVAQEKCDALAGDTKINCIKEAKIRFGKT